MMAGLDCLYFVWMLENALRKSWSDGDVMVGLDCLFSVWMDGEGIGGGSWSKG